jgi:hypothetical protein
MYLLVILCTFLVVRLSSVFAHQPVPHRASHVQQDLILIRKVCSIPNTSQFVICNTHGHLFAKPAPRAYQVALAHTLNALDPSLSLGGGSELLVQS